MSVQSKPSLSDIDARVGADSAKWSEPPAEFRHWVGENAVRIFLDVTSPSDDFEPLRPSLENARVIALGEATHGTSEFFKLKHRFVRFLVTRMGFTAFTIEGFPAECLVVDDYIRTGRGDPEDAVSMIYGGGFPWDVNEVLEMVEWLRKHNETAERKVGFYGFDIHGSSSGAVLFRRLQDMDEVLAERSRPTLSHFASGPAAERYHKLGDDDRASIKCAVSALIFELEDCKERFCSKVGEVEWKNARRLAEIVMQMTKVPLPSDFFKRVYPRDVGQAEMITHLLDLEGPDGKLICWAHNGHVMKGEFFRGVPAMGVHASRKLGTDYLGVGFTFGRGKFRANDMKGGGLKEFMVEMAPRGSLDGALAHAEGQCFVLDLRTAPDKANEWLRSPLPLRMIGGGFSHEPDAPQYLEAPPSQLYDLVAFVRETTAATAIRKISSFQAPAEVNPKPANLDLSDVDEEGWPSGWRVFLGNRPLDYSLSIKDEAGRRLATFQRPINEWAGGTASIGQTFAADQYRGKKLRVSAWASCDRETLGSEAKLALEIRGGDADEPMSISRTPPLSVSETKADEVGPDLSKHTLEAEVPDEAIGISLYFSKTGWGSARVGGFTVEALAK